MSGKARCGEGKGGLKEEGDENNESSATLKWRTNTSPSRKDKEIA